MVTVTNQISKEEYEKAQKDGAMSLITNPALLNGYGVYSAEVFKDSCENCFLTYRRGETCD